MTVVAAAIVPAAPLLVPALEGGSGADDAALREEVLAAVAWVVDLGPEPVVVVAAAEVTGAASGTWDWSGFGVRLRGDGAGPALPLGLAVGRWLLDECGAPPARLIGVAPAAAAQTCAAPGRDLATSPVRRLLVAGRAAWQVLAGAAGSGRIVRDVRWSGAPYGASYLVARWHGDRT